MRRYVSTLLLGALISVGSFGGIALGDDVKFTFTNSAPEKLSLNLFSKTRDGWRWPSQPHALDFRGGTTRYSDSRTVPGG